MTSDYVIAGTCKLCGQEMVLTKDDCWHPWNVPTACPPEPAKDDYEGWQKFYRAGLRSGRPGREHFVPPHMLSLDAVAPVEVLTVEQVEDLRRHVPIR